MSAPINILVVEDDLQLAGFIQSYLRTLGYQVKHEARGDKAVFRLIEEQPELVILDVMLPGLDGMQICQSVRSRYKGMILMLTALDELDQELHAFQQGADDYVRKPVEPELLGARIEALIRRGNPLKPLRKIKFGQLAIDLIKQNVTLADKVIDLKPREYDLLEFLALNVDQAVSRNSIMQALRGIDYDGTDRSIDLRVSYLRKKLNDNIKTPYRIKTIRQKGYVLISDAWEKP